MLLFLPVYAVLAVGFLMPVQSWAGGVFAAGPDDYQQAVRALGPGDVLRLRSGLYLRGLALHGLVGRPGEPIEIRGPDDGPPAVFLGRPGANTISIIDSAYVVIRRLVVDGQGLEVDGIKAEGHANWAHHITLEDLVIRGHDASQQTVGISTKCPAWGWIIRGNTVVEAGTGIYLGDSDGSAAFVDGLIEYNIVRDTIGYNLQVKHQLPRSSEVGIPAGRYDTVIRHNVFSKERGGALGTLARPNVLVGHFPTEGLGSQDRYVIYGNLFYENPTERLFQGEGIFALYDNIFINDGGDAIAIQPHRDVPKRVWVFHNTVLASGGGILFTSAPATEVQQIVSNAVFAAEPVRGGSSSANLLGTRQDAEAYLRNTAGALADLDLRPTSVSQSAAGRIVHARFPEARCDYRGRHRVREIAGALVNGGDRAVLALRRKLPVRCEAE